MKTAAINHNTACIAFPPFVSSPLRDIFPDGNAYIHILHAAPALEKRPDIFRALSDSRLTSLLNRSCPFLFDPAVLPASPEHHMRKFNFNRLRVAPAICFVVTGKVRHLHSHSQRIRAAEFPCSSRHWLARTSSDIIRRGHEPGSLPGP
jgi:hypothetical protein